MEYFFAISTLVSIICYSAIQKQASQFRVSFLEYFEEAPAVLATGFAISLACSVVSLLFVVVENRV